MTDRSQTSPIIIGGVDTHKDLHVAAVVDAQDRVIATEWFSTTRAGYRAMLRWMRAHGDIARVGIECTGSYGAGLMRHLDAAGIEVLEVTAANAARTTPSTLSRPPTPPTPAVVPSPPEPTMGWWNRCGR